MRIAIFAVLTLALATAASARTFRSFESEADAIKAGRLQYAVYLTTLGEITDPQIVGNHDKAERVRVEVLSRDPRNAAQRFKTVRGPFESIARSEDVMFQISDWRKHGIRMMIYLDEFDQTNVRLKGIRGSISMETESND